jgi:ferritin-like metal-binding protein YciE
VSGKLASPRDLFLQLLAQMLWTERTLAFEVLPELHKQVKSESLAELVEEHLGQTQQHVARVESTFRAFGAEPASGRSAPVAGAKDQHEEVASKITDPRLADFFHAASAMQTEQLEIAGYRVLVDLVGALDRDEVAHLLEENCKDEQKALERLQKLSTELRPDR